MWSVVLAVPLLVPSLEDEFPDPGTESELELVSMVGSTHLTLVNPSASPALVIVGREGDALTSIVVPARGDRSFEFPRHTLAGTTLALVAFGPEGPLRTGAYSVDALIESGYRAVWFESSFEDPGSGARSEGVIHAWGELPTGPGYVRPVDDGLSSYESLAVPPVAPGPHVPVITPNSRPKGDVPPRIEPLPLPPV